MTAMFDGLQLVSVEVLAFIVIGVVVATLIAVIPGLGGLFALALLLPFALRLDPLPGLALIIAAAGVSGTGNTITSVMFGVPGSPGGVATILDGYPMAQRGEGARAAAAGIGSSVIGALLGAVFLAIAIPVMRPLALQLGPPEFFVLILGALTLVAYVGPGDATKALVAAGLGLMLSFVGLEPSTGTTRYTFGQLYLWDGVALVPLMIGLFALSEMVDVLRHGGPVVRTSTPPPQRGQVLQGLRDVVTHWRMTLQGSVTGVWVGIAPGLGETAAQFIAYSQGARLSKHPERFGTGTVEGVIASDAATNSKEGGSLIPTLAFGVPGSASMAVLLGSFLAFGIRPGTDLLVNNLDLIWMIIWILVIGNLLAGAISLTLIRPFARLASLRASVLVPPVLILSLFGAFATNGQLGDVWLALVAGGLGYLMKTYGYSRATLLIGFVLGSELERNYLLSMRLFGPSFLLRPITLLLLCGLFALAVWPLLRRWRTLRTSGAVSTRD